MGDGDFEFRPPDSHSSKTFQLIYNYKHITTFRTVLNVQILGGYVNVFNSQFATWKFLSCFYYFTTSIDCISGHTHTIRHYASFPPMKCHFGPEWWNLTPPFLLNVKMTFRWRSMDNCSQYSNNEKHTAYIFSSRSWSRNPVWSPEVKDQDTRSHHRRTAVRPVLTATSQSTGNGQTSTPHRIQTP